MTNDEIARNYIASVLPLSDDPDTRTACVIRSAMGAWIAKPNRLPRGIRPFTCRLERPAKYGWIMHAEINAITSMARLGIATEGASAWLNWFPCSKCAQAIVQAGIAVLTCDRAAYESRKNDAKYEFEIAMAILHEGGVELRWM